jgi:predicted dehydrogenase/threonine dehydrogenase-like Zn-dependent dehydrogenase
LKQVLQSLKTGATEVADLPAPRVAAGQCLIRTTCTLVSAGTERMLLEFGKAGLIDKARQQPDKVRQVIEKIRTDGLMATLDAVRAKLDEPMPMGYCNVGTVVALGAGVQGFSMGDRVASNGRHAEFVAVPANLCAKVPDAVGDEAAAFTVLSAIAVQGMRLAQPTLGESFVVSGLGLIGLLTVQLLRAQGCRVLGMDFDAQRLALARQSGADTVDLSGGAGASGAMNPRPTAEAGLVGRSVSAPNQGVAYGADWASAAQAFSRGRGVDGVLVTASTSSDEPIRQAAKMCRKRGRIVLVGVTGLNLSRADFYEKELSFQVSCSYGPGRYDPEYEQKGHDYPVGFVRWTEQRNFEAVLDMLAEGKLDVGPLVSHRYPIAEAAKAYETILGSEPSLGVLVQYPGGAGMADVSAAAVTVTPAARAGAAAGAATVGFIGAGNYASRVLLPAFKKAGATVKIVASASGASAGIAASRHGVELASSDARAALDDPAISAVVIATRHDSHAGLVCEALRAGKHVFVEKPLALTLEELAAIREAYEGHGAINPRPTDGRSVLMVGFNRRFSPHARRIKALLGSVAEPKCFVMTVNAGAIPPEHLTQDREAGGGRLVGEACHFIDLLRFLAGAAITSTQVMVMGAAPGVRVRDDKASITLGFSDGSIGTIHYFANGHKAFPKERLEVFCAGRILQLDNFRKLIGWGWPGFSGMRLWWQDKGQQACVAAFLEAIGGRQSGAINPRPTAEEGLVGRGFSAPTAPIPFDEIMEVSRVAIEAAGLARGAHDAH